MPLAAAHHSEWNGGPRQGRGRPQFPAGGELWGQGEKGEKGKGSPSLPSPTRVRGHGGLNPGLVSNGRQLLLCTATFFKITHSDFSQVKFFISKPTDTARVGGEGRLAAHRPGEVRYFVWSTSGCSRAMEPTWPPLPQAWPPGAVSQHTRRCSLAPGETSAGFCLPHTSREAGAKQRSGQACPVARHALQGQHPHAQTWHQGPTGAGNSQQALGLFFPLPISNRLCEVIPHLKPLVP